MIEQEIGRRIKEIRKQVITTGRAGGLHSPLRA